MYNNNNNDRMKRAKIKNTVFWDVTPCESCKNRRFGGKYRLHYQNDKIGELNNVSSN
jgi:hypothetical protein